MEVSNVRTLAEACHFQAKHFGNKIAFISNEQELTFSQLNINSNKVCNGLLFENVKEQSRIAYLGKDSVSGYEILFGSAKANTVLITINWKLAAQEVLFMLNDGEVEILFVGEDFFSIIEQIQQELKTVKKIITLNGSHDEWENYEQWCLKQAERVPENFKYNSDDVVVQIYTSGTTGNPKGVQLSNYSFFDLLQNMKEKGDVWMDLNPNDKVLLSLPIFHIGGLWWAVQSFLAGAQGVIIDVFVAWRVLNVIEDYKISKLVMVPAMIQFSLAEPSCMETNFSSVKGFLYGGSPIPHALLCKAMAIFDCDFFQAYGMTETGNIAVCLRPEDHTLEWDKKMQSAGKPLPGVEACIINLAGDALPIGETGEICLKSPSNMLGYWKQEEVTKKELVNGWMHTGDAGYIDENGYVYVCDRIKDMIIYAGENVYPAEIESVLADHESIIASAVIGVPNETWGEVIKAFVVLKSGTTLKQKELILFLKDKIAGFKIPKSFSFVESLPRNPSGKILKRKLRESFLPKEINTNSR